MIILGEYNMSKLLFMISNAWSRAVVFF